GEADVERQRVRRLDPLVADVAAEAPLVNPRPDERRVLAHEVREVDGRQAREEAPVGAQAMRVPNRDRRRVPDAAGDAEADGGMDVELAQRLDDADLKDAAHRAAGEEEADAAGVAEHLDHGVIKAEIRKQKAEIVAATTSAFCLLPSALPKS